MSIAFAIGMQSVLLSNQQLAPVVASFNVSTSSDRNTLTGNPQTEGQQAQSLSTHAATPAITPMDEMAELVNLLRVEKGVPPVRINANLTRSAQAYTQRMANGNFFGHNDPDNDCNKPFERALATGYAGWTHISENIAAGQATAQDAMTGLTESPSHYKTLINPNLREVGISLFTELSDTDNVRIITTCPSYQQTGGPYLYYWAQDFGSRQIDNIPVLPVIINNETFDTDDYAVPLYIYGGVSGQPPWANEMRFSEDGQTWTAFEPWQANKTFSLTNPPGLKTVYAELKHIDSATQKVTTQIVSDTIYLNDPNQPRFVPTAFLFIPVAGR